MTTRLNSRRSQTYRDDFASYQPWWRVTFEIVAAMAEPITRPLGRVLRGRSRRAPPLGNRMRRDVGLPPLPEHDSHHRWR